MTSGDRMWVAFWGLLILANLHDIWWLAGAVVVLVIGAVSDYVAAPTGRET